MMHHQLVSFNSLAKLRLHGNRVNDALIHGRIIKQKRSALALSSFESDLGILIKRLSVGRIGRE